MLSYNDVVPKKVIVMGGEPYEVLSSHVFAKQQRKPVNQTKLRNLKSGKVTEHSFHQAETIEEADVTGKKIIYLYRNRGQLWFCEEDNKAARFSLPETGLENILSFAKENSVVDAVMFNDAILSIRLPIKVELTVKQAEPAVRGNTAQGASKQVTLETGFVINVPLFIGEGDIVRINTETGEYTERVEKR